MVNLLLFLSSLIHYIFVFGITVILVLIACKIGIEWRKKKNSKEALEEGIVNEATVDTKQ